MSRIITQPVRSFYRFAISSQQPRFPCALLKQRASPLHRRNFAYSPTLYKKKDKAKKGSLSTSEREESSSSSFEDPFDLSPLHDGISSAIVRLKDDLSKLRAGGRFNTVVLESLRVHLGKDSRDSVKLGDLAQVVPKGGRMVTLLAAEEDVSLTVFFRGEGLSLSHKVLILSSISNLLLRLSSPRTSP